MITTNLLLLSCLSSSAMAFVPQTQQQGTTTTCRPTTTTRLNAFAIPSKDAPRYFREEDDAWDLMKMAQECANSEECSIDDARSYLNEVVYKVESGCIAGTLVDQDLCDVGLAVDIVANLRNKIEKGSSRMVSFNSKMNAMVTQTLLQMVFVTFVGMVMTLSLSTVMNYGGNAVLPFTMEEWYWSVRDGYLPRMMAESMKYGGLPTDSAVTTAPFTLQEWWWSIKDGYLPTMLTSFVQNGGHTTIEGTSVIPFTFQEWFWSIRDGYFPTMVSSSYQHGGHLLVDGSANEVPVPYTMQEWYWAAKDGYLSTMISDSIKNGGL